ncbi:hypothetical protein LUZ63_011558 [Rhynchospora breviuscula]|uniref:Uncharacterized protein n=1 Tax=Rhynchospora breviuscula TaxID=2022672 RepID=A0A9Q0HR47_9POAL|nr:hypothetical protein LUZ63_011558 [Rhynchospora breviuscula]
MNSSDVRSCDEERSLGVLLEAFGSCCSLEEIASAYCRSKGDVMAAGDILCGVQDFKTQGSDNGQREMKHQDSADEQSINIGISEQETKTCEISTGTHIKLTKSKKATASLGTVSSFLGNSYTRPSFRVKQKFGKDKPPKIEVPKSVIDVLEQEPGSSHFEGSKKDSLSNREIEQSLFLMLGEGFKLSLDVIREVLGKCGYDIHKSMEELLAFSARSLGKSKAIDDTDAARECNQSAGSSSEELNDSLEINSSLESNNHHAKSNMKDNLDISQQVLQSLFTVPERLNDEPVEPRFDLGANKIRSTGSVVSKPLPEVKIPMPPKDVLRHQLENIEDISSTAFIESVMVTEFVSKLVGRDLNNIELTDADIVKINKNLKGEKVEVTHRGNVCRKYRISGLTALTTRDLTFQCDEQGTMKKVVDHFREAYNHNIRYVTLPCLVVRSNARKPNYLPMEVCKIVKGQRYRKKLNENQITNLRKATCQKPIDREKNILNIVRDNKYKEDIFVTEFGLTVSNQPTMIEARLLPPPSLKYNDTGVEQECIPRFGQWNMKDKKLVNGGKVNFWYCISFSPQIGGYDVGRFCKMLGDMCRVSGMEFAANPILPHISAQRNRLEEVLKSRYQKAVSALSHQGKLPDLLIVILPNSNGKLYSDLKRICETDIDLVTQCCLTKNVMNAKTQYLANVALKINVKVGGRNTVLADAIRRRVPIVSRKPTIIFGADVTHPYPGEDTNPSIAAVVASQDWPEIAIYAGTFRPQAPRQEIISHLGEMVIEHLKSFKSNTNMEPQQIIFYRDGVGESQFQQVLQHEITAIKSACKKLSESYSPTITFIVVQKRHHTRIFPANNRFADRSGNVLPGTVVDTKICHPKKFDFYLCSHASIQGTSHPAHYHVLWDDNGFNVDELQELTYNLCYTYARCTRSVSIVPPVYYAHRIAFRARSYLDSGSDSASFKPGSARSGKASATVKELPVLKDNVKKVMFYC